MKFVHGLAYASLLATATASEKLTEDKAEADIKQDQLQNVLWNLQKIARDNGGNRAFGLPGYKASMDFVLERAQKRFGKHMDTWVQPFTHLFQQLKKIQVTGPDGKDVIVISLNYNPATPLPGGISGELVNTPVDDTRGSGCFEDQWQGIDAKGKIALVKRGICAFSQKVKLAKAAGATAVILYNNLPGDNIPGATLGAENVGKLIPSGLITLEKGSEWSKRLAAGEKLTTRLLVDAIMEERESWNIISETKEGDPNNVVMLGAHLDGVQAGPGVNDDGSGTAALLEIMGSFKKYTGFKNKVRFAWWGAEESGLIGSLYYGSKLSEAEADKIRFYFNYDMIGSKEPQYAVYADNDAHMVGATPLFNYINSKGKPAMMAKFGTSSDYVGFLKLGIPSSGLFTGAGAPYDVCYHQACDDVTNINWDAMVVNTKAAARAAAKFALSLEGVPPRDKTTLNPRSKKGIRRSFDDWADTLSAVDKTHNCGSGTAII